MSAGRRKTLRWVLGLGTAVVLVAIGAAFYASSVVTDFYQKKRDVFEQYKREQSRTEQPD